MAIKVLRSVNEIGPKEWDRLGCRMLFETHGWLSANESTLAGEPLITAEFHDEKLQSAIAWQATDITDPSPYYNINALVARFADGSQLKGAGWTLNCTGVGAHSPMLAAPGVAFDVPRLTAHISAAVETRGHMPGMCGVNFLPRDPVPGIPDSLRQLGFREIRGYERAFLEISGNSYDGYLAKLSSRERWNARRDRKRYAETGQVISFSAGSEAVGEDLVRLQGFNKMKYGQPYDDHEVRTRFAALLDFAGEDSLVVRSHRGTDCAGFTMFFRMGDTLHALCAGFEDTSDRVSPYFECLFHAPIEWACRNNVKEIDYGIGSAMAKSQRGCAIVDVSTWFLPEGAWPRQGR